MGDGARSEERVEQVVEEASDEQEADVPVERKPETPEEEAARLGPPIKWPPLARDLTLAGVEEVMRIVREMARWLLRCTCEEVCITDEDIRKLKSRQAREDLIATKITAYEWFFGTFQGVPPRLSLEEVCRVLHRDPKFVRARVRANPAAKATRYKMPPGYRAELLSEARGAQAWKRPSELAAEAAAAVDAVMDAVAAAAGADVPVAESPEPALPLACIERARTMKADILEETSRNTRLASATSSEEVQAALDVLAAACGSTVLGIPVPAAGPVTVTSHVTESLDQP